MLTWLVTDEQCLLPEGIIDDAAESGNVVLLMWLYVQGCKPSSSTMCKAATAGELPVLKHLHTCYDCDLTPKLCSIAAYEGYLEMLQWLCEQGCPWYSKKVAANAAYNNDVQMLQYMRQRGVEFSANIMQDAARGGAVAACQYLHEQQQHAEQQLEEQQLDEQQQLYTADARICQAAAENNKLAALRWLREHSYACNVYDVYRQAAVLGYSDISRYMFDEQEAAAVLTAEQRNKLLEIAERQEDRLPQSWAERNSV